MPVSHRHRHRHQGAALAVLCATAGFACGASDARSNPESAIVPVDQRSSASTLLLTVAVRVAKPAPAGLEGQVASFIGHRHIADVELRVDAQPWGRFRADTDGASTGTTDANAVAAGFSLYREPSPALVVAALGGDFEENEAPPATAGDWSTLLQRHLAPGGHVAEITRVHVAPDGGQTVELMPQLLVPFEVAEGAASAYVGALTVDLRRPGAAP